MFEQYINCTQFYFYIAYSCAVHVIMILFFLLFYFHEFDFKIKNLEALKFHKIIINLLFFNTGFILLICTQV
jgi:hypothetical protein